MKEKLSQTLSLFSKKQCLSFGFGIQNINRIGAVGGFASEPAFGLVRLPAGKGRVEALANLDLLVLLGQAKRTEKTQSLA